jgi:hypothetical protein
MPKYRITSPDGRTFDVTAPDGATQDQVMAYVQAQHAQAPKQTPAEHYAALQQQAAALPQSNGAGTDGENFWAGMGKSFVDTGHGLLQLGATGARFMAEHAAGDKRGAQFYGDLEQKMQQAEAARRQIDAPLTSTKAAKAGEVTGVLSQLIGPGIALRGTAAGAALLPRTVIGNVAQGVALGSAQPVVDNGERGTNMLVGGVGGAIGAGLPRVAGGAIRAGKNAVMGVTARGAQRDAVRLIQGEASSPANLLASNPSVVHGATRSLFEESLDPGVARLETRSRGNGGGWAERDSVNNLARSRAIEGIAGDQASRAAAENTRSAVTDGLRDAAFQEGDQAAAAAAGAGFSPAGNVASLKARLGALVQAHGGRSSVQRALSDVVGELDNAEPSVQGLYNVRKSINDMIEGKAGSDKSYATAATRELMQARTMLDEEIQHLAPSFGDYLNSYRALSKPLNRMDLGQHLLDSGTGAITDPTTGAYRLSPNAFGRQVKSLDVAAQKATGFDKARAADILSPQDMATVGAVNDDLARQAQRLLLGSGGGSHTASQTDLGKRVVARAAIRVIPGFKVATEFLEQAGARRLNGALEEVLSDPNKYRIVAGHLSASDRRLLENALVRIGGRAGAVAPALTE